MPIHEYFPIDPPGCALCCYGFELLQGLSDAPLTRCTACGTPLHRVIGGTHVATGHAHVLREKNVAKQGFTKYRRVGKGKYEKVAGKGPDTISGD
ncbi:MAG: zinc ribbon domain-containing protein [Dokdonella sp.]